MMKRDMELIRRLLLEIESTTGSQLKADCFPDVDAETVAYHFRLLDDAGFIPQLPGSRPVSNGPRTMESRVLSTSTGWSLLNPELSWEGCEFLDKIRDETVWKSVREKVSRYKSVPLTILASVATAIIQKGLGLE
jgi:hypothetical protein